MAVRPGEENVATLFGDVHYFYGPPTASPPHHRFDKGSYVYLFENANERRARIEVANQPGTEEQDAFDGFLDKVHVTYSYRQQCVVSLVVGDVDGHEEWHLPTYDPRNENKYHYKLHSLDIYFWTHEDALSFVSGVRRVLPPDQVDVQDEPAPPPQQHQRQQPAEVSSVVQRLENVAIANTSAEFPPPPPPPAAADPTSQGGSGSSSSSNSTSVPSFAAPPLSAVSAGHHDHSDDPNSPSPPPPASFAPMAYNPAAPAAPEQIQHREKTPPPEDGALNPLQARLMQDAGTPFSPGLMGPTGGGLGPLSPGFAPPQFQPPPGAPTFPAPPVGTPGMPPQGFGVHPQQYQQQHHPHPGLTRAATMPAATGIPSPALQSPYGTTQPFPASPAPPYAPAQHTPPPVTSPGMPPPPPGGYSNYSYMPQQQQQQGQAGGVADPYAIHHQAYRPTEGEVAVKYTPKKEVRGRLEENAGRIEKSVTGMLKRFEKKFG